MVLLEAGRAEHRHARTDEVQRPEAAEQFKENLDGPPQLEAALLRALQEADFFDVRRLFAAAPSWPRRLDSLNVPLWSVAIHGRGQCGPAVSVLRSSAGRDGVRFVRKLQSSPGAAARLSRGPRRYAGMGGTLALSYGAGQA